MLYNITTYNELFDSVIVFHWRAGFISIRMCSQNYDIVLIHIFQKKSCLIKKLSNIDMPYLNFNSVKHNVLTTNSLAGRRDVTDFLTH